MVACSCSAWAASVSDVAETSSEAAAFCWVTLSSCWIAWLIWAEPTSCSRQAAVISSTSSAVFLMSGTRRESIVPASWATFTVSTESVPISAAAAWLRSASLRTSEATTAKPLPCSPARAASTAALRASRSVWRAISCTMLIFWAMVCMASTALPTAMPEASASLADWLAIFSVVAAFSAFCFTFAAISSIEAEASSVDAACSVEPSESCSAEAESSCEPEDMFSAAVFTWLTTSRSFSTIAWKARWRSVISSRPEMATSLVRSPAAMLLATPSAPERPLEIDIAIQSAMPTLTTRAPAMRLSSRVRVDS